ncbi:hypothetical protein [Rubrivivax rivuli]|uniref:Uncharacterized protein n=1 Tax=Rubrivivax rivuli TaxID=1862385 RepID=A0A437RSK0_9BURK|nr:hypothetical protein [Rubrivivax rivuli]RVU49721.1 hypothetical protein EOE66_03995 [Rubrivivax rivuli]
MNPTAQPGAFSALDDEAIHAFTPAPGRRGAAPPAPPALPVRRRRLWPWLLLLGLALVAALLLTGVALVLDNLVEPGLTASWHLGHGDIENDGLGTLLLVLGALFAGGTAAVLATAAGLLAVLLLMPLGLAIGLLGAALGVAAVMLAVLAGLVALLLPLWLPLLLLWLLLRQRQPAPATPR